jgi:hypothetical protein
MRRGNVQLMPQLIAASQKVLFGEIRRRFAMGNDQAISFEDESSNNCGWSANSRCLSLGHNDGVGKGSTLWEIDAAGPWR